MRKSDLTWVLALGLWAMALPARAAEEPEACPGLVASAPARVIRAAASAQGEVGVERIHSTMPEVYAVGGRKPVLPNAFTERVRKEMKPFLAKSPAEFAPLFPDHATITGLGLGCVINLPIVHDGAVLGTVNLLDAEGTYDERHVEPAMTIARQILPVLLAGA